MAEYTRTAPPLVRLAALPLNDDELELLRVQADLMERAVAPQHCDVCRAIATAFVNREYREAVGAFVRKYGPQGLESLSRRIRQLQGKSE